MTDLTGRVALVTGPSSGIGAAIARTFAGLGAPAMTTSRWWTLSSFRIGEHL